MLHFPCAHETLEANNYLILNILSKKWKKAAFHAKDFNSLFIRKIVSK